MKKNSCAACEGHCFNNVHCLSSKTCRKEGGKGFILNLYVKKKKGKLIEYFHFREILIPCVFCFEIFSKPMPNISVLH